MGTGKTTVGKAVARALAMTFVDMDDVIAGRTGAPVAEIFASRGEAHFRDLETALAKELGAAEKLVVATGGGAMLRAANRVALGDGSLVVCLRCAADEVLRRLEGDGTRPLLDASGAEPAARLRRIEALLAARAEVYDSFDFQIDVTRLTVDEVAALVIKKYRRTECKDFTSI